MASRIPAPQRTREERTAMIEGCLSAAASKDELVKLAIRPIVEEALDGEAGDAIGSGEITMFTVRYPAMVRPTVKISAPSA